jgi:hypothetical protein
MIFLCGAGTNQLARRPLRNHYGDNHSSKCYGARGQGINLSDLNSALEAVRSGYPMRTCTRRFPRGEIRGDVQRARGIDRVLVSDRAKRLASVTNDCALKTLVSATASFRDARKPGCSRFTAKTSSPLTNP